MPTATAVDPQIIVRDAIRSVTALATLPEVTMQIVSAIEDPKSSAGRLHKIISHDPSLAARILKVVNSSFYGFSGQIGSTDRAIVLLGLNAVKNIAVAASLGQMFRGAKLGEGFSARDLWAHCIAVGVTARELANSVKLPIAEEAFLAGLIHDVGILVELQTWPEKLQKICATVKTTGSEFCQVERQILGVDHPMLGKGLAESWKFPKGCQQVAAFHHDPAAVTDEDKALVAMVYIADTICCQSAQGFNLTAMGQEIDPDLLSSVGLDAAKVEQIKTSMPETISKVMSVFT